MTGKEEKATLSHDDSRKNLLLLSTLQEEMRNELIRYLEKQQLTAQQFARSLRDRTDRSFRTEVEGFIKGTRVLVAGKVARRAASRIGRKDLFEQLELLVNKLNFRLLMLGAFSHDVINNVFEIHRAKDRAPSLKAWQFADFFTPYQDMVKMILNFKSEGVLNFSKDPGARTAILNQLQEQQWEQAVPQRSSRAATSSTGVQANSLDEFKAVMGRLARRFPTKGEMLREGLGQTTHNTYDRIMRGGGREKTRAAFIAKAKRLLGEVKTPQTQEADHRSEPEKSPVMSFDQSSVGASDQSVIDILLRHPAVAAEVLLKLTGERVNEVPFVLTPRTLRELNLYFDTQFLQGMQMQFERTLLLIGLLIQQENQFERSQVVQLLGPTLTEIGLQLGMLGQKYPIALAEINQLQRTDWRRQK